MTDEQINAAIAVHLGWSGIVSDAGLGVMGVPPTGNECDIPRIKNAMWTKDLNAMHDAESMLQRKKPEFSEILLELVSEAAGVGVQYAHGAFAHVHAPARLRAEAFLRTLGKWEEVQG